MAAEAPPSQNGVCGAGPGRVLLTEWDRRGPGARPQGSVATGTCVKGEQERDRTPAIILCPGQTAGELGMIPNPVVLHRSHRAVGVPVLPGGVVVLCPREVAGTDVPALPHSLCGLSCFRVARATTKEACCLNTESAGQKASSVHTGCSVMGLKQNRMVPNKRGNAISRAQVCLAVHRVAGFLRAAGGRRVAQDCLCF